MASTEKLFSESLEGNTYRKVLRNPKKINQKMFRHITKAGPDFGGNV